MKKETDYRARLRDVKRESEKALCRALLAGGGSCSWGEPCPEDPEDTSGDTCCPVITGSYKHADITEEYTVYKAATLLRAGPERAPGRARRRPRPLLPARPVEGRAAPRRMHRPRAPRPAGNPSKTVTL